MKSPSISKDHALLLAWYRENRRDLPWRKNRDPYGIWISEVMLQQTTVAAVIPYYEKFLKRFPNVKSLADAPESEVLKLWAGLGYYSRARNLHKAAKALAAQGFPKTAAELIEYPGFGPYTSAAVASIAFGDPVGVLDGNVIRVLSRKDGLEIDWWNSKEKQDLQRRADAYAQVGQPDEINQALMELGATVCTPQSPVCLLCPWSARCVARATDRVKVIPKPKPRKKIELWTWEPVLHFRRDKVAMIQAVGTPVMKGQWIFPGDFAPVKKKPESFHARHGITHHDLYVRVKRSKASPDSKDIRWISIDEIQSVNPSQLLQKVLATVKETR